MNWTLFTREESLALAQKVQGYMHAIDETVSLTSLRDGTTQFALNEIQRGDDDTSQLLQFGETIDQRRASVAIDRLDDASLQAAVAKAEALAKAMKVLGADHADDPLRPPAPVNPALWSDSAVGLTAPEARFAVIDAALSAAEKLGLVGGGMLNTEPSTSAVLTKDGHYEYGRRSRCEYSLTVRTPDGTGSGWATWEGEDWSKCDTVALTERAIDLAQRSRNPIALEPGRYTVVMTPEACGELVSLVTRVLDGEMADHGLSPFSKPGGGNKIGLKVLDERVSLSIDPMDPDGGFIPFRGRGGSVMQFVPVTWVDHGVLKALSYRTRALAAEHGLDQYNNPNVLRMAGGPTSIDEMIDSTQRGIYVTRFSDVAPVSMKTLYMTGVTRDGTFLIENGKITKPVKNFRFEDSPFFFLNALQAIGPARRVPGGNVMPPVMVRDFAFTSLTDAV
jgi:predicted Zn-dependent protease